MIEKMTVKKPTVAVFSVGHGTYWDQFPGLLETLGGFHKEFLDIVAKNPVEILDFGIISSQQDAAKAADRMNAAGVRFVFCNMITYATSSVFAPILRNVGAPMVLVALQPRSKMDYPNATTRMQLENDNICSVPEFCGAAVRMNKTIQDIIVGRLYGDEKAQAEIRDWCLVACALERLHNARVGLMGHVLESMYDMHTDPTALYAAFGVHAPLLELDALLEETKQVTPEEIEEQKKLILSMFDTPEPKVDTVTRKLTDEDLERAARSSAALMEFIKKYDLDGLAYFYEGTPGSEMRDLAGSLIVGNSLLIARGIPMCGEYDIKTCIAMMIMEAIGIGGSFAEIHPIDFENNCVLVGHDGPHHIQLAEGKPVLRSLTKYHGKAGSGASVEFQLRKGPITILSINQDGHGKFRFVIGEGISREGEIPATGNTNTRVTFGSDTVDFLKRWSMAGPTHHFAMGCGNYAGALEKLGKILNLDTFVIQTNE